MLACRYQKKRLLLHKKITSAQQSFNSLERLFLTLNSNNITSVSELLAFPTGDYHPETLPIAQSYLDQHLIPALSSQVFEHPSKLLSLLEKKAPDARLALAAVEMALWGLMAKKEALTLSNILGGKAKKLAIRPVLSLTHDIPNLKRHLKDFKDKGYNHFKIKINSNSDLSSLIEVYQAFPELDIVLDANESLNKQNLNDLLVIKHCIPYLEQPLPRHDWQGLAWATEQGFNLCLDESVRDLANLRKMQQSKAARRISLKPALWGGFIRAKEALEYCKAADIKVSVGGLYESSVGRAYGLAFATLDGLDSVVELSHPSFTWKNDDFQLLHTVNSGHWELSDQPGLGFKKLSSSI